jgi:hypothetical protein
VTVKSLDAVGTLLRKSGLAFRGVGDCLVAPFPQGLGHGAWRFSESNQQALFN